MTNFSCSSLPASSPLARGNQCALILRDMNIREMLFWVRTGFSVTVFNWIQVLLQVGFIL